MTAPHRGSHTSRRDAPFRGQVADRHAVEMARARLADALVRTGHEDRAAFHDVYALTSSKLFGICLHVCGDRAAAEEVLHDVYLTVWKRAGAWNPSLGTAVTWLSAIARNRSIDWRRQEVRRAWPIEHAGEVADLAPGAEQSLLTNESDQNLRAALHSLKPCQRDAIRDAFFHGATYAELATRHGVPLGTMKSWVRRGLARMKERLDATAVTIDAPHQVAVTPGSAGRAPARPAAIP